jgi:hypothetical protein
MTKDIDSKLLESLKKEYDSYLKKEGHNADSEVFDAILTRRIEEHSQGGKKVLTETEVNTFNQFIRHHNGKFNNSNDPQFYPYAVAQDDNKNLFLLDRHNAQGRKLESHGTDTDFLQSAKNTFISGNDDLDKLKKAAVEALADGIISPSEAKNLKKLSRESDDYDISVITRKDGEKILGHHIVVHKDGKADGKWGDGKVPESGVEMVVTNTSKYVPMKDADYYMELERKAEKTRAEAQNPDKDKGGRQ